MLSVTRAEFHIQALPSMLSVLIINVVRLSVAAPMEHSILYDRGFKTSCDLTPRENGEEKVFYNVELSI
jgi:hypothetical protein